MTTSTYTNDNVTLARLRSAAKEIYDNSYKRLLELETAKSNPVYCYEFTDIQYSTYAYTSKYNLNGHFVNSFGAILNTAKFNFGINLMSPDERSSRTPEFTQTSPYMSLKARYEGYSNYIDIFVNGIKVNSENTFITVYNGSIDLYLHQKYFTEVSNTLTLITNTKINQTKHFYSGFASNQYSLNVPNTELVSNGFTLGTTVTQASMIFDLFVNGKRKEIKDLSYTYTSTDGITINLTGLTNTSYVELTYGTNYQLEWEGTLRGNQLYIPLNSGDTSLSTNKSWDITDLGSSLNYTVYHKNYSYTFSSKALAEAGITAETNIKNRWDLYINGKKLEEGWDMDYYIMTVQENPLVLGFAYNKPRQDDLESIVVVYKSGVNEGVFRQSSEFGNGLLEKYPIGNINVALYKDGIRQNIETCEESLFHVLKLPAYKRDNEVTGLAYTLTCNKTVFVDEYPDKEYYSYSRSYLKYRLDEFKGDPFVAMLFTKSPTWIYNPTNYPPTLSTQFLYNPLSETKPFDQYLVEYINDSIKNDHVNNFKRVLKYFAFSDKESYAYGSNYTDYLRADTSQESISTPIEFSPSRVLYRFTLSTAFSEYQELVFIDGIKVDPRNYTKVVEANKLNIYLLQSLITATSQVTVWVIPVYNTSYQLKAIAKNGTWLNTAYTINESAIGTVRKNSDIVVFTKAANLNLTELVLDTDYTLTRDTTSTPKTITITPLSELAASSIYVANASFTEYNYKVGVNITGNRFVIDGEIYTNGTLSDVNLKTTNYNILFYKNGKFLTQGTDYFLIRQKNGTEIKNIVIFSIPIVDTDFLEYYYVEKTYETLNYESVNSNPFGMIYLKDLQIPYDDQFVDVYVNGKLLRADEIEDYTSKIIRINEENIPAYDIVAKNNLNISLDDLSMFLDNFKNSSDLYMDWILDNYYQDDEDKLDDWYSDVFPTETPNEDNPDLPPSRTNPMIYYIIEDWTTGGWLTDPFNSEEYALPRIINANEDLSDTLKTIGKYLPFFSDGVESVAINANTQGVLENDYALDANLYSGYSPSSVNWVVNQVITYASTTANIVTDGSWNANKGVTDFYKTELSKHIHASEFNLVMRTMNNIALHNLNAGYTITINANTQLS